VRGYPVYDGVPTLVEAGSSGFVSATSAAGLLKMAVTRLRTRVLNCNEVSSSLREMASGESISHPRDYCSPILMLIAPTAASRFTFSIPVSKHWSPMPGLFQLLGQP